MNGNEQNGYREGATDWNVMSITPLPTPDELKAEIPLSETNFKEVVGNARETVQNILSGEDQRLVAIVGPCSVHSITEAEEYAGKLAELRPQLDKHLFVLMRACLDKPRTARGWAGFCHDPDLNGSCNFQDGWRRGRKLLVSIVERGLPVAMEFLEADTCQSIDDCVSYYWIGARTVTSPRLRQIASALSTAVGFKNLPDGNLQTAVDAMELAWHQSAFVACNHKGIRCEYRTNGNKWGHLILRGTDKGPNYDTQSVADAAHLLAKRGLPTRLFIDASHGNSGKKHEKQRDVIANIIEQVLVSPQHIAGFLYESYLEAGCQKLPKDLSDLKPRISVTDGCDDWETTKTVLLRACDRLAERS